MAKQPESQSFMDMFAQFGKELKMPKVDVDAILEHHRKNLDALEKSARASAAGASSILARQREMVEESLHEIKQMAQGFGTPGMPKDMMAKQADFARKSFETAVKNTGEVAEMMKKSGGETLDILRERIKEAMSEIRQGYDKNS